MPDTAVAILKAKIDEFGDLDLKIQQLAPDIARHAVLKTELAEVAKAMDADRQCVAAGVRWTIWFTPRENRRRITNARKAFDAVKKVVGLEGLIALITIPFEAAIDKHVPEELHKLFLVQERVGPRTMKVVPNSPPAPPAAA